MTTPADHMTIAEIIHDYATRYDLYLDRGAREDLAAILEQRMVAERAEVLRETADVADSVGHHWSGAPALAFFALAGDLRDRAAREIS